MKPARKGSPDPDAGHNPKVQRAYNLRPTRMRKSLEMRRGQQNIFPAFQTARVLCPQEEDRGPEAWFSGDLPKFCPRVQTEPHRGSLPPPLVSRDFATLGAHRADPGPLTSQSTMLRAAPWIILY